VRAPVSWAEAILRREPSPEELLAGCAYAPGYVPRPFSLEDVEEEDE
jgi:hypothetical protein